MFAAGAAEGAVLVAGALAAADPAGVALAAGGTDAPVDGDAEPPPHALTSKMTTTARAGVVRSVWTMNSSSWELG